MSGAGATVVALSGGVALSDVGHGLREALYMAWDTLWALVLGFVLSGAVQAFVPRETLKRQLGDHRPASIARASAFGMVSSSCSYGASAMARSLFVGGSDFLAAMAFMFASTNLVIELGIALAVLIGWQFLAAEYLGGVIMIVLLVVVGGLWFRDAAVAGASTANQHDHQDRPRGLIRTARGWSDAAGYTIGDLWMLRREVTAGFVIAGFLSALVPSNVWAEVFLGGHGIWTQLENAAVGPLVAAASFVCSVGNVALAAALWRGGISFGGVIAFVFADLITIPLILVYRSQYGWRMALRMLGAFWLVMSASGLLTGYLFGAAGLVPAAHRGVVVDDTLRWGFTTYVNIAALIVFSGLYWLHRSQGRLGGGSGYDRDPVCGMQVEVANAPATVLHGGRRYWFCSDNCADRFAGAGRRDSVRAPSG